jgi:hypothetical protein
LRNLSIAHWGPNTFALERKWGKIRFIDETTLVYTGTDYRLWRFDLDTWESELLWKPYPEEDENGGSSDRRRAKPDGSDGG